ncbi:cysteine proteinase inhibitor 12-like isoform X1 [Prunus avium]|uniref:Cysteine proteinase inhibitor n=1 Tax=Prunus avium TaxID=42229 RepID=A0A6P5S4Y4_PRUAV|nr:cysteine proteinase inhibitor 12-like isoform X1 [Prunus avium]
MALRYLFGGVTHTGVNHTHLMLKPYIGFCALLNHNALIPISSSSSSSAFVFLHGSPSFSSANPISGSQSCTTSPPCGGTSIYMGAHEDDWIIRLAKFAVEQHNFKESKNLQYVRVLGASHTMVSSILYHITLETVDATKPKIYHAVVWLQILKNFMELLAWKPVNDRLSVLGVKSGDLKLHEAVMFYMNDVQRDRFLY